jgi:hypothetical protein
VPARADFARGVQAYDGGDYRTAAEEWRLAAEGCDPRAETALAMLYQDGLGVPRDIRRAIHWYERAARAGDPVAQMSLGDLYAVGRGTALDRVRAYVWLDLAAGSGKDWAARRRDGIERKMTVRELHRAKEAIRAFRPMSPASCQ